MIPIAPALLAAALIGGVPVAAVILDRTWKTQPNPTHPVSEDRSEPGMPTLPLALASALYPAPPELRLQARMAELGVRRVIRWDAGGTDLMTHPLSASVVLWGGSKDPIDRAWLRSAFGTMSGRARKSWLAPHAMADDYQAMDQAAQLELRRRGWVGATAALTDSRLEALQKINGVADLIRFRLRGELFVMPDDAQELLPWAILFGQGHAWLRLLITEYAPLPWLECGPADDITERFSMFCQNVARVGRPF